MRIDIPQARMQRTEDLTLRRETVINNVQQQVQKAIDVLVDSGAERGLQVAVYRNGEQVVDAVADTADPATGRPVESDTVFYTYSVGKAMASTLVHMLVERGMFGYDTTIAELWRRRTASPERPPREQTVRYRVARRLTLPSFMLRVRTRHPRHSCLRGRMKRGGSKR